MFQNWPDWFHNWIRCCSFSGDSHPKTGRLPFNISSHFKQLCFFLISFGTGRLTIQTPCWRQNHCFYRSNSDSGKSTMESWIEYIQDKDEALKDTWNEENAALIENRVAQKWEWHSSKPLQKHYLQTLKCLPTQAGRIKYVRPTIKISISIC